MTSTATSRVAPAGCAAPSADQFAAASTSAALPAGGTATPAAPAGSRRPGAAASGSALEPCWTRAKRLLAFAPASAASEKRTSAGCEPLFAGAAERTHATAPAAAFPLSAQPRRAAGRSTAPLASRAVEAFTPDSKGRLGTTGTSVSVALTTASPLDGSSGSAPGVDSARPEPASAEPPASARNCSATATGSPSEGASGPTRTSPVMGSTTRSSAAPLMLVPIIVTVTARPSGSAALIASGSTWPGTAPVGYARAAT